MAIRVAQALRPDVVLMDIRMPKMNGIEATAVITATCPGIRILIMTTFDLDEYVLSGLKSGASGFLLKDAPPAELLAAIRAVVGGESVLAPSTTRRLISKFLPLMPDPAQQSAQQDLLASLTDRKRTVLTLIANGQSNREIAAELHLSEGAIKIHVGVDPGQARPARPDPGRRVRLRIRAHRPRQLNHATAPAGWRLEPLIRSLPPAARSPVRAAASLKGPGRAAPSDPATRGVARCCALIGCTPFSATIICVLRHTRCRP
jgi:DNA-binding NarL/FixJ family response regulator